MLGFTVPLFERILESAEEVPMKVTDVWEWIAPDNY